MQTNGNQRAFPVAIGPEDASIDGMSKLEYFSAMAMQGILSRHNDPGAAHVAETAVFMAKALIVELNKTEHHAQPF